MRGIKKYIYFLLFAIILFLPFYTEAARRGITARPINPSGTEVTGNQWLFVIGIDTYIHWPPLNTAVSDAKSLKDVLISHYYFDKNHLIELYDEQATRKNILGKLRFLAKNVNQDDSVVIFYAGHGHLDPITKEGSWVPVESDIKDASAWISNHDIKNYLRVDVIKAKHILLISDSCFSGDFFRGHRGRLPEVTDEVMKRAYKLTSRQAITSGGLEPVSDEGFGKNSVFSHFLVKALKENQKPFLVPSDFFSDIKAGVVENAEQFPRFGSLKDTGGQQGGELVLFLKQDSKLKAVSTEASERKKEFEHLKKLEVAAVEARKKEEEEIARHERELAELDTNIRDMKKRLGKTTIKTDDSLDAMLVMVRQKERQQQRLEELKRKRQEEEAKRRTEIEGLRARKRKNLIAALEKDIHKYLEIVSSDFGKDMKKAAWNSLVAKYPEAAKGLKAGDTQGLLSKVKWSTVESTYSNSIGMKFVFIRPGTFLMGRPRERNANEMQYAPFMNQRPHGSEKDKSNERQHAVTLTRGFYMQTTEVTQGKWYAIMGTRPWSGRNHVRDNPDCPAVYISWDDCQDFIRRLNQKEDSNKYRLPTEAEWEYASRAGSTRKSYFDGSDSLLGNYVWYKTNAPMERYARIVGSKRPNAWGLYDMHANVWEWCQDWYEPYPNGHVTDPEGPSSGSIRVFRGGLWSYRARECLPAFRRRLGPDDRGYFFLGFRVVRDL
jgi:formylglycine-generating enzyme required for sulfatase activity